MRILTRYVLSEVLSHAAIGAALFTFVIFMRDLGRILELVVRNSAPLPSVAEIFLFTLPMALTITIPMGVLVGILIGLSRLAADSEITAMRASGIGAGRMVRMVALFVIVAWGLALLNNMVLAPKASAALGHLQDRLKSSQASFEIQPRVFYEEFPNYVLYVQDVHPAEGAAVWDGVFLADIRTPSAPQITMAQHGVVTNESPTRLRLHLINGSQHQSTPTQQQQYSIQTFEQADIPLDLPATEQQRTESTSASEMATADLLQQARVVDASKARQYMIEFHRRLALPTSCLVLALVGIPLGLSAKKGGKSTGFVLTIGLVFLYYVLSLVGMSLARQGRVAPAPGIWFGNFVFFIGGLILLWRVDHMPIEFPSARALWLNIKSSLKKTTEVFASNNENALEKAAGRKRVFGVRFPLILDDLILRDFLTYLAMVLATFLVLLLVFTLFELLGDIWRNHVPAMLVGEYLVNVTPYFIYQTVPIAVLLAVLVTFGLMQKSNEVTAMKATGISIYRVIFPVLVIAALMAGGLFFFDEFYLPRANKRQDALRNRIKGKPAQTYLRPDRKWIFGEHATIYYYEFFDPDHNTFGNISAFEFDPKTFELTKRIYATRARWSDTLQKWVFEAGWARSFNGTAIQNYRPFYADTFAELNETPMYFKKEVKQSSEMSYSELRNYIHDLQQSGFDVVRLRVQLQKKFAFPLITLVMAVLAIPFALSAGRRGALAGVALAIGIAVVYFVISGLFEAMGNANQLPAALAAWSPDLIFAFAGGYLILKIPT